MSSRLWRLSQGEATSAVARLRAAGGDAALVFHRGPSEGHGWMGLGPDIVVELDPEWSQADIQAWAVRSGFQVRRRLPLAGNFVVLAAPPTVASLELAANLVRTGQARSAWPNWVQPVERR